MRKNEHQAGNERNRVRILMCLLCESEGCAIWRVSAFTRAGWLLRKPKGASGPFGNPDRGLLPLEPKESALFSGCRLVPRYGPCSVVCMRFFAFDCGFVYSIKHSEAHSNLQ